MNGLDERYKTLGQLRAQLQLRLGFISSGPGSQNNKGVLNSFLQESHDLICSEVDVKSMQKRAALPLVKGSARYDWHNDTLDENIDPGRIISIWVQVSDQNPVELCQGITEADRSFSDQQAWPTRWDNVNGQMEVWPVPDASYRLIIWYTAPQARFERDADRPSVPDRLVFLYALSVAKAHYRHVDAQVSGKMFERQLNTYKAAQHENQRYFMKGNSVARLPDQVIKTANGYALRVS